MGRRGQVGLNEMVPWIIGIGVLALVVILYMTFSDKGEGIIDYLKNLWRFGR